MSTKSDSTSSSLDNTVEELRALLAEAENALSSAGDVASDEITALRTHVRDALAKGRATARHALEIAKEKATEADKAVHAHPYLAIGIAAGLGALVGVLLTRRMCSSRD